MFTLSQQGLFWPEIGQFSGDALSLTLVDVDSRLIRVAVVAAYRMTADSLCALLAQPRSGIAVVAGAAGWTEYVALPTRTTDVIVLDLSLGNLLGLAGRIRALNAIGIRTVLIGDAENTHAIQGAVHAGALAFVPQTAAADELVRAIHSAAANVIYRNRALEVALRGGEAAARPGLGKQEDRALKLYASGNSVREVALMMATTEETVKSYLKRARRKYRDVGIDLGTKILLRGHSIHEGWFRQEA